jgi:hypothetical protein
LTNMDRLTDEELEEWRQIIQTFPASEREKWKTLVKSGRLLALVSFLDSTTNTLEKLGTLGMWLNKVVKGIIYLVAVALLFKFVVTDELALDEIWKLFVKSISWKICFFATWWPILTFLWCVLWFIFIFTPVAQGDAYLKAISPTKFEYINVSRKPFPSDLICVISVQSQLLKATKETTFRRTRLQTDGGQETRTGDLESKG